MTVTMNVRTVRLYARNVLESDIYMHMVLLINNLFKMITLSTESWSKPQACNHSTNLASTGTTPPTCVKTNTHTCRYYIESKHQSCFNRYSENTN